MLCCKTVVAPIGSPGMWNRSAYLSIKFSTCCFPLHLNDLILIIL